MTIILAWALAIACGVGVVFVCFALIRTHMAITRELLRGEEIGQLRIKLAAEALRRRLDKQDGSGGLNG